MKLVGQNDTVKLHYTGTLENGEKFDSSEGREPLAFTVGGGQVIPGFEKAVVGMTVEQTKKFTIPSDEAYGAVREELIQSVPVSAVPAELNPTPGQRLVSKLEDGREIPVTIKEVTDETITLDANHPLAGKDLTFDITIVAID